MTKEEIASAFVDFMQQYKSIQNDSIANAGVAFTSGAEWAIEAMQAENARLRYELELLKNPAEKHLHDQLSKAVGDSLNDQAAEEIARLREALEEAVLQIEYLHEKFKETGSGNNVLSRIKTVLEQ